MLCSSNPLWRPVVVVNCSGPIGEKPRQQIPLSRHSEEASNESAWKLRVIVKNERTRKFQSRFLLIRHCISMRILEKPFGLKWDAENNLNITAARCWGNTNSEKPERKTTSSEKEGSFFSCSFLLLLLSCKNNN